MGREGGREGGSQETISVYCSNVLRNVKTQDTAAA